MKNNTRKPLIALAALSAAQVEPGRGGVQAKDTAPTSNRRSG